MRDLSREFKATFGSLLRDARKSINAGQSRIAADLNVSVTYVSRWETGKLYPTDLQVHDLNTALQLSPSDFEALYNAWYREWGGIKVYRVFASERPDTLIDHLKTSIASVRRLRTSGDLRNAIELAARDTKHVMRKAQQSKWSPPAHHEIMRGLSDLVLEQIKAGLDFMPRRLVRNGGLAPELGLLKSIGEVCNDTTTRFVAALALEGVTYVGGDVASSFRQTQELLQQAERIPEPWVPEVLRASAINAGKERDREALVSVEERIRQLVHVRGDQLPPGEVGFVLEGLARGWGEIDPGRATEIAEEAWEASGAGGAGGSYLRFVQLARTQGEIGLLQPRRAQQYGLDQRIDAALKISRQQNFDRYVDQLELLHARLSGATR